jgi:hypothetical protein
MTGPLRPDGTPPAAPLPAARPLGLREGLRRLSRGLLAYGTIGLIITLVGLVAMLWVGGRLGTMADRVGSQIDSVATTLEKSGTALTDAGATASSFSTTLTQTSTALDQAADSVTSIQPKLADLETQFRSVDILGNQPLGKAADVISGIRTSLDGLDTKLHTISGSLSDNQTKLEANGASLTSLGSQLTILARDLRAGAGQSVDDIRAVIIIVLLVLVSWTAVPAIGALALGMWLRRTVAPPSV